LYTLPVLTTLKPPKKPVPGIAGSLSPKVPAVANAEVPMTGVPLGLYVKLLIGGLVGKRFVVLFGTPRISSCGATTGGWPELCWVIDTEFGGTEVVDRVVGSPGAA